MFHYPPTHVAVDEYGSWIHEKDSRLWKILKNLG